MILEPDFLLWEDALRSDLLLEISAEGTIVGAPRKGTATATRKLSGRAIFPGLVNAHSHAFQRLIRGRTEYVATGSAGDDFWSWRELMYRAAESLSPEELYSASRQVFLEMAQAGITSVGEFHYLHHQADGTPYDDKNLLAKQVVKAARDVGLRIVLLRVAYARSGFQKPENPRQRRFIDKTPDAVTRAVQELQSHYGNDPFVSVGLAPHSVRAVPADWLKAFSSITQLPLHMHVGEQPLEVSACLMEHRKRPVELLDSVGLLRSNFTAVHGVHLEPEEVSRLGRAHAQVCACPSTERNLGDGIVPADALLRAGVSLSLGSDSQAHVDLFMEARQLDGHLRLLRLKRAVLDPGGGHPSGLALRLFRIASEGGARSLGLRTGVLGPGMPADFFTVDLSHCSIVGATDQTLLASLIFAAERGVVCDVAVQGRFIVENGRHPDQEMVAQEFTAVSRKVLA
ncbi:MAG: formimidoylglutamate deiminase [Myxococcaceae bacterium]